MSGRGLVSRLGLAIGVGALWLPAASAGELFTDDFEDMSVHRWHVGGDGKVEVHEAGDGHALRLTKRGYAIAAVRIDGKFTVRVEASLAGQNLEDGDFCVAEASADGGAIWMDVLRLGHGDGGDGAWQRGDDLLTLPGAMSTLVIRLRAETTSNSDYCWADDIHVSIHEAMKP